VYEALSYCSPACEHAPASGKCDVGKHAAPDNATLADSLVLRTNSQAGEFATLGETLGVPQAGGVAGVSQAFLAGVVSRREEARDLEEAVACSDALEYAVRGGGTQFTCFTGTKVQILTLLPLQTTSRPMSLLLKLLLRLLSQLQVKLQVLTLLLSLLALLVQKYKYEHLRS
jgi:hypothetical protein